MRWGRAILVLALLAGALLRLPRLDLRPMHTDEAVHGIKFGALLEHGFYRYDKHEYHGPTLNYITLLPAWLSGQKSIADVDETTLRRVTAVFGLCLILLIPLLKGTPTLPVALATLLAACSPAMVFYSRYYIQETLLVCFAFFVIVTGMRLAETGKGRWAAATGAGVGLMFATKETWIISCGAMAASLLAVRVIGRIEGRQSYRIRPGHVGIALLCSGMVSVVFFSSFFTNWQGVPDSLLAYQTYFTRAGETSRHGHPWYYYVQFLLYSRGDHGPAWTEIAILVPGIAGIVTTFKRDAAARDLRMFLALYAVMMFVVISAMPYKTPWVVLGALQPMIVLAGYGLADFWHWCETQGVRRVAIMVPCLLIGHLGWQSFESNFVYFDDPVNPYVYAQPRGDVREIGETVKRLEKAGGTPVQVVAGCDDYWPLPWYLRGVRRVGWWSSMGGEFMPAPVILATPDVEPALLTRLYELPPPGKRDLYVSLFDRPMFLRPGKEIRGYITVDLRNRLGDQ